MLPEHAQGIISILNPRQACLLIWISICVGLVCIRDCDNGLEQDRILCEDFEVDLRYGVGQVETRQYFVLKVEQMMVLVLLQCDGGSERYLLPC